MGPYPSGPTPRAVRMDRSTRLLRLARMSAAVAGASWLAACVTPPASAPAPSAAPTAVPAAPAPAAVVEPPAPAPEPPSGPVSASAAQQAQRLASAAIELLEGGHEDQALAEVQRALQTDPNNRLAQSLLRQIQSDPQVLFGREFFIYRVEPGESLSRIAGRFLRDVHLFYGLARYNDIKVPRMLQGGQAIKVPGRQPPPGAPLPPPVASPAPAMPAVAPTPPPPAPRPAPAAPPAPEVTVAQDYRRGLSLMAQQKPAEAVQAFDQVLEREPDHANAKLKRAQAMNQVTGLIRLLDNKLRRLDAQLAQDPKNAAVRADRDKTAADRDKLAAIR